MSMALSQYITDTLFHLHDTNGINYPKAMIVNFINRARSQIATKTNCVRELIRFDLIQGQEVYTLPAVNANGLKNALNVLNISVPWGTFKPTLNRWMWSDFQAYFRSFSGTLIGMPSDWALYPNRRQVYISPIPQQDFSVFNGQPSEWDCTFNVTALANDEDVEPLNYAFTDAVSYYAAMLALINAQRYQESQAMKQMYVESLQTAQAAVTPTFIPTPY